MPTKPRTSGRTIVVGDVHGCRDEAERLLDLVGFGSGDDRLFFMGDLLSRGPDPEGVLALVRRTGAASVRGNHDDALIQWRAKDRAGVKAPIKGSLKRIAEHLDEADWKLLESLPLHIELPDHDVLLVHAGVVPGVALANQSVEALLSMRYLGPDNEPIEKGGTVLWGTRYEGPPHVVFGHNAQPEPQLHAWATGIDTAAVYGGRLTAMVLEAGQKVPAADRRREVLHSVAAKARYFTPPAK